MKSRFTIAIGVLALAVPSAAVAKPGTGHGGGKTKPAQYVVEGTYAGGGVVSISHVSGHARKAGWKGQDIAFDLSSAEIRAVDANLDGTVDVTDVAVGDEVQVKARLPKGDPGAGPYVAQRLVDLTTYVDEDGTETE